MNIQRATPINELLAKIIFLIVPTILVSYFLFWNLYQHYSLIAAYQAALTGALPHFFNQVFLVTLYLGAGMLGSALVYALRFRFLPTAVALYLLLYGIFKGIDSLAVGEFDTFFASVQFLVFAVLFGFGWLLGWGFIRPRYWAVFLGAAVLVSSIVLLAKMQVDTESQLMLRFLPGLLYPVYIIFTAEQIYSYKDKGQRFWWFLTRRLVAFGVLALMLLGGVYWALEDDIKDTIANYGGAAKAGDNSMLKQNKDGTFDLKHYSQLRSSLGRSNELLFAAHIDNFFEGSDVANPLYLTAFHYTRFDTSTETFERDSLIPFNDLFEPDPSKVPLFGTRSDSSVIRNSLSGKFRHIVEAEVFNIKLSRSTYLAPSTGFFVQPITVEKDFRDQFISAYRTKSYVSALNSAYFVYNAPDPEIRKFQEQRFEVLREVKDYKGMDSRFMAYYTDMPKDPKFQRITDLARKITAGKQTPVDKVLAIRDWFLSNDSLGQPLFKYTDNPGVPDIPSASKLMYFLFENRKGYCAYYAGATLFMLRALGIPSRITAGFLTQNRSDKNKGWYWYYADQAHAWVQVYFPGFGWLDFDTTVGNTDARDSPKPDGTPPMQPPKAWLAAEGTITEIDTLKKLMTMDVQQMVFLDKEYRLEQPVTVKMDMKIAAIRRDSLDLRLSQVRKGETGTAVSYAEAFKKFQVRGGESGSQIIARFPSPAPIDELYLKRIDTKKPDEKPKAAPKVEELSFMSIVWTTLGIMGGVLLLIFLSPWLVLLYLKLRHSGAKAGKNKAYWAYRTAGYYLHQVGVPRGSLTPMQYALKVVDPQLGTRFAPFMNLYLKQKYAKQELTAAEEQQVNGFLKPFLQRVRKILPAGRIITGFLNPGRMVAFFAKKGDETDV